MTADLAAQVYHDLVPVICDLLGGHRRRIATALLGGSLLPLAMFLTWNAVTLAVMPSAVCDCRRPVAPLMHSKR